MKALSATLAIALGMGSALYAAPSMAANAKHPYSNINRQNDKGNPTGDDQIEKLNQQQLDQARSSMGYVVGQPQPVGAPAYQPMPR